MLPRVPSSSGLLPVPERLGALREHGLLANQMKWRTLKAVERGVITSVDASFFPLAFEEAVALG
jgi:hypothetical protein